MKLISLLSLFLVLSTFSMSASAQAWGKITEWGQATSLGMTRACLMAKRRAFEDLMSQVRCTNSYNISFQIKNCIKGRAATSEEVAKYSNIKNGDFEYTVEYNYTCN